VSVIQNKFFKSQCIGEALIDVIYELGFMEYDVYMALYIKYCHGKGEGYFK